jgi:glycerol-3-phosphate dehydrogenase
MFFSAPPNSTPITEQMFAILENGKSPQQAIEGLMTRAARSEIY